MCRFIYNALIQQNGKKNNLPRPTHPSFCSTVCWALYTETDRGQGSSGHTSSHTCTFDPNTRQQNGANPPQTFNKTSPPWPSCLLITGLMGDPSVCLTNWPTDCNVYRGGLLFTWLVRWCMLPATCSAAVDCFQAKIWPQNPHTSSECYI